MLECNEIIRIVQLTRSVDPIDYMIFLKYDSNNICMLTVDLYLLPFATANPAGPKLLWYPSSSLFFFLSPFSFHYLRLVIYLHYLRSIVSSHCCSRCCCLEAISYPRLPTRHRQKRHHHAAPPSSPQLSPTLPNPPPCTLQPLSPQAQWTSILPLEARTGTTPGSSQKQSSIWPLWSSSSSHSLLLSPPS